MSNPQEGKLPDPPPSIPGDQNGAGRDSAAPAPVARAHTPVQRLKAEPPAVSDDAGQRREFFSEAMRETLAPLAFLLERKINPVLAALEAIPAEVERITGSSLPKLDQPHVQPASRALPQATPHPPAAAMRILRPPGALPPGEYESACSRCGQCVAACPAQAIQLDGKQLYADGLPYIIAANQPCVVCESLACMSACPTGALKPLDRLKIKMGTARVTRSLCRRETGEDCRLCVEACPITGPGAAPEGDAITIHPQTGRVIVRKNICIGCGLCESRCPTFPAAIQVEPFRNRLDPIIA